MLRFFPSTYETVLTYCEHDCVSQLDVVDADSGDESY